MTQPGALALTGLVALLLSATFTVYATHYRPETRRAGKFRTLAWSALAVAVLCFVGATWWEALS